MVLFGQSDRVTDALSEVCTQWLPRISLDVSGDDKVSLGVWGFPAVGCIRNHFFGIGCELQMLDKK